MSELNYQILHDELQKPEYNGLSNQEAADSLNAVTIVKPTVTVQTLALKAYMFTRLMPEIIEGQPTPKSLWLVVKHRKETSVYFEQLFDVFDQGIPAIDFAVGLPQRAMLEGGLNELIADPAVTFNEADKAAILSDIENLAAKMSRAEQLGYPALYYWDIERARHLGEI